MLSGEFSHLTRLIVDDVTGVRDMVVDELLVLNIGERAEEDDRVGNQCQAPKRHPLDEPVANEGGKESLLYVSTKKVKLQECTYSDGDPDVLRKQDSLEFDNEEVEQFGKVIGKPLKRVFLKDKVLLGSNFGCQATSEGDMACNFGCGSNFVQ